MIEPLRIAVLTTGRQDYGILRSTCLLLAKDPRFALQIVIAGMHLDASHGGTAKDIESDGLPIAARLETSRGGNGVEEGAATLSRLAPVLLALRTEALLLVGDRLETAAAALAATAARVPIIHLHGGEETEGAIDNVLRHAITKQSHLHLVSNETHARRIRQMGESDESVVVVGAPGLDNARRDDLPGRKELERSLGIPLAAPVILVTYHPTTLGSSPEAEARELVASMSSIEATWVVTLPNNDEGSASVRAALQSFVAERPRAIAVDSLGSARYFGMMQIADAMLGNSSSGILEAPILGLPVVNVGDRQKGRLRGSNVIDVAAEREAISDGLRRALDPAFRAAVASAPCPYGDGKSAARIVAALAAWKPTYPPRKAFVDREVVDGA